MKDKFYLILNYTMKDKLKKSHRMAENTYNILNWQKGLLSRMYKDLLKKFRR